MPRNNVLDLTEKRLMCHRMLRDHALKSIKDLHTFALSAIVKPNDLALLPGCLRILKQFVERFINEQSSIIESLVELNHDDDIAHNDSSLCDTIDFMYFEICDISARFASTPPRLHPKLSE